MNDTVTTEDQEQPAGGREQKARTADRDPGRRTSSGPADICSAPTEAGHMTAADQIVRSAEKCLPRGGRPHMSSQLRCLGPVINVTPFSILTGDSRHFQHRFGAGPINHLTKPPPPRQHKQC
jgi:hypothetical protein